MGAFCSCLNGPKKDKVADERAPLLTDGSSTSSTARADSHILVLIDGDDFLVSRDTLCYAQNLTDTGRTVPRILHR